MPKIVGRQIAQNSANVGDNLTWNGNNWGPSPPSAGPNLGQPWRDPGPARVVKAEGPTVAAGATYTMLNVSGAGYITYFFMSVRGTDAAGRQNSRFKVYVDNEVTPSIDVMFVDLACARGMEGSANSTNAQNFYMSEYTGYMSGAFAFNGVGYQIWITIPFSTHVKVDITNGSGSNSIILGGFIHYHLKSGLNWGLFRKLHGTSLNGLSVAPYAEQNLVNVSGHAGAMYGLYLHMQGGDGNYNYLEGNTQAYVDGEGTSSIQYDSTEDYFGFPWYFWSANNTRYVVSPYVGVTRKDDAAQVGAYRWHVKDPLPFTTGFRYTWFNGEIASGQAVNTNTTLHGVLWYYEQ